MTIFRLLPTIIVKFILKSIHGVYTKLCKVNSKKITFASYRSDTLKDNLYFVSEDMKRRYPNFEQVYLLKKFEPTLTGKIKYINHLLKACFHLSTSRYFIIDDYYLPVYLIRPRKDVEVIQLWHGSGALKKFGLSTLGKPFGPSPNYLKHVKVHGNYSKVYVSSKEVVPYYAEAFGMSESAIKPLGIPRTDYFYNPTNLTLAKEKLFKKFPELTNRILLLYAPTFRGKSHHQDEFQLPFDVSRMEESLSGEYALLIHLHPYMKTRINIHKSNFVYHIEESFTIQELLAASDVLITDYSTVFFDFSILERPIVFYAHDLETYIAERDFYYDYEDLIPGPIALNTNSLITIIKENNFISSQIAQFRKRFFDVQDGKATERVVDDIFELNRVNKEKTSV